MTASRFASLILLILNACFQGSSAASKSITSRRTLSAHETESVFSVNATCPRFVFLTTGIEGFGDQLSRAFTLLAAAKVLGATAVFDDFFGMQSRHHSNGYKILFRELGFPTEQIVNMTRANQLGVRWVEPLTLDTILMAPVPGLNRHDSALRDPSTLLACGAGVQTDIESCKQGKYSKVWCPSKLTGRIQSIIRPILDEMTANRGPLLRSRHPLLRDDHVNIVWHVRTGDICIRCGDISFYKTVDSFLRQAFTEIVPFQNIVIHMADPALDERFQSLHKATHFTGEDPMDAINLFLNADVLVTLGSSFATLTSWPNSFQQPLILQSEKKEFIYENSYRGSHYDIIEGRAFRLDGHGNVIDYLPEDALDIIANNGVLNRINANVSTLLGALKTQIVKQISNFTEMSPKTWGHESSSSRYLSRLRCETSFCD